MLFVTSTSLRRRALATAAASPTSTTTTSPTATSTSTSMLFTRLRRRPRSRPAKRFNSVKIKFNHCRAFNWSFNWVEFFELTWSGLKWMYLRDRSLGMAPIISTSSELKDVRFLVEGPAVSSVASSGSLPFSERVLPNKTKQNKKIIKKITIYYSILCNFSSNYSSVQHNLNSKLSIVSDQLV